MIDRQVGFFETLRDFELDHFITRRVVAMLYRIYFWLTIIFMPILAIIYFWSANQDLYYGGFTFRAWTILIFPGSFLWGLLAILWVRLLCESAVALVTVAENTKRQD